jgi:hypothetical protein
VLFAGAVVVLAVSLALHAVLPRLRAALVGSAPTSAAVEIP